MGRMNSSPGHVGSGSLTGIPTLGAQSLAGGPPGKSLYSPDTSFSTQIFFFKYFNFYALIFDRVGSSLLCRLFLVVASRGCCPVAVCWLLTARAAASVVASSVVRAASVVAHRLQ